LSNRENEATRFTVAWQEVEQCGWRYESWLQANYGKAPAEPVDDDGETKLKRSEVETKTLDTNNLKPGVKLTKQKVAKWKEADHYGILGLQDLRFDATTRQIRAAHRALSLRFHPDKLGRSATKKDEEVFAVITKSCELLTDPMWRPRFDSIDPKFDDALPKGVPKKLRENFFDTFTPVFERNSRWAPDRAAVPHLGTAETVRDEVEAFYEYWYDFKSWRDYHWEDEEDIESAADRYEKREIEKFNRSARQKKKKAEMARIRKMVDLAYDADPRVAQFMADDKEQKQAAKKAAKMEKYAEKIEAAKKEAEAEEKRKQEEEIKQKAKAELEADQKKAKKAAVNAAKKQRKVFRQLAKEKAYWIEDEIGNLEMMEKVEFLCVHYNGEELAALNGMLGDMGDEEQAERIAAEVTRIKAEQDAKWVKS